MRRFVGVLVGAFIAIGLTAGPALAWSNDTTAQGVSECASKKDRTAKITWTFTIDTPGSYHGRTVVTQSNDSSIPVGTVLTDGGSITETRALGSLPFTLVLKVNYPDPGGDNKWYPVTPTPSGSLTVRAPLDCQPVQHSPQLVGSGRCDETTGPVCRDLRQPRLGWSNQHRAVAAHRSSCARECDVGLRVRAIRLLGRTGRGSVCGAWSWLGPARSRRRR